jgi:hypothetical protein
MEKWKDPAFVIEKCYYSLHARRDITSRAQMITREVMIA